MATKDEKASLEKWVGLSPANEVYFKKFRTIWENTAQLKAYETIDTESSLKKVKEKIGSKSTNKATKVKPLWIAVRIAAIVIIFFGIYMIGRQKTNEQTAQEIIRISSMEETKSILLPDSSMVYLNKSSIIEYDEKFSSLERKIKLNGEAYFEVKPDKTRPFVIETSRSVTRVLGTSFNLKAHAGSVVESIVVTSGLVEFSDKEIGQLHKVQLKSGEKAILGKELIKETNTDLNFLAWKTGTIIFQNEPLPKAVEFLSEFYGVKITLEGDKLKDLTLTGKYEKKSLDQMMEILEMTLQIKVEGMNGNYRLKP
jgi:ferric-dicitrate binding protein FerR (iron transport regulator)